MESPKLEYHKFVKDELILVMPPGFCREEKKSVSREGLKKLPFIFREKGSGTRMIMEKVFKGHGFDVSILKVIAKLGSTTAVIQAIKSGAGASILSRRAVEEGLSHGTIKSLEIEGIKLTRDFFLVLRKGKSPSSLCNAFLNFLLEKRGE